MHYALVTGILFGTWPVIARGSGLSSQMIGLLVSIASLLINAAAAKGSAAPSVGPMLVGLLCGVLNGIAVITYGKVLQTGGQDISKMLPIVGGLIPLIGAIGGMMFFKEPVTFSKVGATLGIIVCIFILNK